MGMNVHPRVNLYSETLEPSLCSLLRSCVANNYSAPLIPLLGFSRAINSLLTYLLTCIKYCRWQRTGHTWITRLEIN